MTDEGIDRREPGNRQVYIVDDDPEIRESLKFLLATRDIVARAFDSGTAFFKNWEGLLSAPIILDIRMPGMTGLEFLNRRSELAIEWPVIVLTGHGEIGIAVQAIKQGAMDFLEKPVQAENLEAVLRQAFNKMDDEQRTRDSRDSSRKLLLQLTRRESEVLAALCAGKPNKQVALDLSISPRTVEMHRSNALHRLGLRTIAEVVTLKHATEGTESAGIFLPNESNSSQ